MNSNLPIPIAESLIYEDNFLYVCLAKYPITVGHTVVVWKDDVGDISGLEKKDYDFILSVTANVTSSLPLAATLLTGNPLIGLGALAVNAVVGSQVSKAASNYYSVTGPWNNPNWRSVSTPGKSR